MRARNKWCLTGTPFGNRIEDIKPQLEFIGMRRDDLSVIRQWELDAKGVVLPPSALPLIGVMKESIMRHRLSQLFNGRPILNMPEPADNVILIDFEPGQLEIYDSLYAAAKELHDCCETANNDTTLFAFNSSWWVICESDGDNGYCDLITCGNESISGHCEIAHRHKTHSLTAKSKCPRSHCAMAISHRNRYPIAVSIGTVSFRRHIKLNSLHAPPHDDSLTIGIRGGHHSHIAGQINKRSHEGISNCILHRDNNKPSRHPLHCPWTWNSSSVDVRRYLCLSRGVV